MNEWTKEECEILAAMWRTHTSGQIALKIKKTRNSVIGKARRMGLFKKPSPIKYSIPSEQTPPTIKAIYAEIERNNQYSMRKGNRTCYDCSEPVAGHNKGYCNFHHSLYHEKPKRKEAGERVIWRF